MKQILIIPNRNRLLECLELVQKFNLGFEYNDFFMPDVLDDSTKMDEIITKYSEHELPGYTTVHGAFFDVIPFSMDSKIRDIATLRINQSLDVARKMGARAVVFHTNYDPFLNSDSYVRSWIEINKKYWKDVLQNNLDLNIYLENMFDTSPDIMLELSEYLSQYSNYGVCLDYAHASLSKVEPYVWAERLGEYVKHVHINDNDLVSDLHMAWGAGKINREKFYECYEKFLNNASVLIETTLMENQVSSLEMLKCEGFI